MPKAKPNRESKPKPKPASPSKPDPRSGPKSTSNAVGWFEIPVTDMDRAVEFYETVLRVRLERHDLGDLQMAWFPSGKGPGAPGTLIHHRTFYKPSMDGVLIYLSSPSGDLANELARVPAAGGTTLIPKRRISPEYGCMGAFRDSEGNRIALHSRK